MFKILPLAFLATLLISGCGGGSDGGGSPSSSSAAVVSSSSSKVSSSSVVSSSSSLVSSSSLSSSSKAPSSSSIASSSIASSSSSVASSSSSAPKVVLSLLPASWYGNNGVSVAQTESGANVSFTADWNTAGFYLAPEIAAIEGYTVEIDVKASSEFVTSGGALKVYAFVKADPWPDEKDCSWLNHAQIVAGTVQTVKCTISTAAAFTQTTAAVEIQLVGLKDAGVPNGTVLITGGRVIAP